MPRFLFLLITLLLVSCATERTSELFIPREFDEIYDSAVNMIEDEEGGFTKSRVLVAFAPDHSPEEMQANVNRYLAAAEKLGVKARAGKIDDEVAEVYVDAGPASKEMKLLNDLQRDMLQATGYFGGDEAIKMQPMLESHKTNTSVYLTEHHFGLLIDKNRNGNDKQPSFKLIDSGLTSLMSGLNTVLTLPSSTCGCPPMTNIRYGKPT